MTVRGFAVELNEKQIQLIKTTYNLKTDAEIRSWLQMTTDLLLARLEDKESNDLHK